MGMYDTIIREPVKCPGCGRELNDFQSKSGFKELLHITPEQLVEDSLRMWGECWEDEIEYYDYCIDGCGGRLTFSWNPKTKDWDRKFETEKELYPEKYAKEVCDKIIKDYGQTLEKLAKD